MKKLSALGIAAGIADHAAFNVPERAAAIGAHAHYILCFSFG